MGTEPQIKRILVVEDSSSDANLVRLMLEAEASYWVHVVGSLSAAARAVEREPPSLILLDLQLPDASGLEAVDAATEFAASVPIVVLTGSDDETLAIEALKRGAQDYISKNDANPKLLRRVVRHAEERQRLIRALREAQDRLEQQSRTDPLTGLLNRRGLEHELERECRLANRSGQTLHVIVWDLDDFKAINDRHGHAAGDELLTGVAERASCAFRDTDTVGRIGGDEFMALLRGARAAEASITAERLCGLVAEPAFVLDGEVVSITVSVGVVEVNPERHGIGELLRAVDGALYRSKDEGKNRVSHVTAEVEPERLAAAGERAYVAAEPMLEPTTESPVAYELLLRVPGQALDCPDAFFAMSRRANWLTGCDLDAFERAVLASKQLDARFPCHINLFPSTLRELGAEKIGEVMDRAPGRAFCIDLSEQQLVGDPSMLLGPLGALRAMGHSIGLDHIGSSRSSLETLLAIEPEVVKLDVRWTRSLTDCPGQRRELEKLLRILAVSGSTLVVARPANAAGRELLLEIGETSGVRFLWSDPGRSTRIDSIFGASLPAGVGARP